MRSIAFAGISSRPSLRRPSPGAAYAGVSSMSTRRYYPDHRKNWRSAASRHGQARPQAWLPDQGDRPDPVLRRLGYAVGREESYLQGQECRSPAVDDVQFSSSEKRHFSATSQALGAFHERRGQARGNAWQHRAPDGTCGRVVDCRAYDLQRSGLSKGEDGSEETGRESLCPVRETPEPVRLKRTWRRRKCRRSCDGLKAGTDLRTSRSRKKRSQLWHVSALERCCHCLPSSSAAAPASSENSTRTGKWSEPASSCTVTEWTTTSPFAKHDRLAGRPTGAGHSAGTDAAMLARSSGSASDRRPWPRWHRRAPSGCVQIASQQRRVRKCQALGQDR